MDRTWGAYANVSMEGRMTETLKTYKNCNISQDLIDNFTSVRAIIQYLIILQGINHNNI